MATIVLMLMGGLGALLIGMSLLQEATEKLATGSLKKLFAKTANRPWAGIGIGTLSTMIMQSSGATTVMVVGFVNAGAMSLAQATAYIMGANIGTTITAQIAALSGFNSDVFPITAILISLSLVGVVLRFAFSKKYPNVAQTGILICGLGLLFLGLDVMTRYMSQLLQDQAFSGFLAETTNPFLLLFLGIVLTVLAQSSSAITSVIIAMAVAGAVIGGSGNGVLYIILGSNIGSCSTALISAIGSTVNGKRAAVIHLLFNTFGVLIFFIILTCWPDFMNTTLAVWFAGHPATQIAMFHTLFNVICTLLFEPFIKFFVKLAELIIPEKKTAQPAELDLLDARFLKNPGIALNQAIMYYHLMAKTALEDLNLSIEAFAAKDKTKRSEIDQIENKVLAMSKNLTSFIVQISSAGIGEQGNLRISKMQLDIADIVRLTEVADNMTGYTIHEVDENLVFSDIVFVQLDQMKKMLNEQFAQADQIVDKPSLALLEKTRQMEDAIDAQRTMMISGHMARLAAGECHPSSSGVFINLVGNLERCGDHLNFISERACQELLQKEAKKNQQEILPPHP